MLQFPPTIILRHRRENLKKCSLRGLESNPEFRFFTYPRDTLPDLTNYILLTIDAPILTQEDASYGLFLIDGTWKYAETMERTLPHPHRFIRRSLPNHFMTAYPRKQTGCEDPSRGLASIEALYLAFKITKRPCAHLLDNYHFKEEFLQKNKSQE